MPSHRSRVRTHTDRSGTDSHREQDADGMSVVIQYTVYDCTHCGESGIASKADFDTWEEVWQSVRDHLAIEHPSTLND